MLEPKAWGLLLVVAQVLLLARRVLPAVLADRLIRLHHLLQQAHAAKAVGQPWMRKSRAC